jgi:hypothetical protein
MVFVHWILLVDVEFEEFIVAVAFEILISSYHSRQLVSWATTGTTDTHAFSFSKLASIKSPSVISQKFVPLPPSPETKYRLDSSGP